MNLPFWEAAVFIIWLLFMKSNEQSQQHFMNVDNATLTIRAFPQLYFQFCISKLLTVQITKNHWFMGAMLKSVSTGHFISSLPFSLSKSLKLLNQHGYKWQTCFMSKCGWAENHKRALESRYFCNYRVVKAVWISEEMDINTTIV